MQDRLVALHELLIAALTFADVVEEPVLTPAVVVAVLVPTDGVSEEQDGRRLTRRADAALPPPAVALVDLPSRELFADRQTSQHAYLQLKGLPP